MEVKEPVNRRHHEQGGVALFIRLGKQGIMHLRRMGNQGSINFANVTGDEYLQATMIMETASLMEKWVQCEASEAFVKVCREFE